MAKKTVTNNKFEANATLNSAEKATLAIPNKGHLEQAEVNKDGINIKQALGTLKLVDIADVDLLLTFANGERIVIPNGALDAVSGTPPTATFHDQKIALPELLKYVGLTYQAKPGSLRLVSENIDANPPSDIDTSDREPTPVSPPPAPVVKVSPGTGVGKGLANGLGDVPETYNPLVTAQPSVYRVGKSSVTSTNEGESFGSPKVTSALYTSSDYKVSYSGMPEPSPQGEYDALLDATILAEHISPANQSNVETITGTSGNDLIEHNTSFSGAETQWSKTLHIGIDNFTSVNAITVDFSDNAPAIDGFNLVGLDGAIVTPDSLSPLNTIWHITPTTAMLKDGVNVAIVYNIKDITTPGLDTSQINFTGDIKVEGKVGAFNFEVINNLYMTWRDAITQADFNVTTENGTQYMVLPQRGVGVIIYGDNPETPIVGGDDTINAGAGNDLIFGGLGADRMNGGAGNDTVTYENAHEGITAVLTNDPTKINNDGTINSGDLAAGDTFVSDTIENIIGSSYNDVLIGDSHKNILNGGEGNDTLMGIDGGDTFVGGTNDSINNTYNSTTNLQGDTVSYKYATSASGLSASLSDGKGGLNDVYIGIENLTGSSFSDTLEGDLNANVINGGSNNTGFTDYVSYEHSSTGVSVDLSNTGQQISTGDANGDILINIQNIKGSAYNDTFTGNLLGNAFNGLGGINTVTYANSAFGVTASLKNPAINLGAAALGDTYSNIQNLIGTVHADILYGDNNANQISGGDGNDQIYDGIEGGTKIDAGAGDDKITIQTAINTALDTTVNNIIGGAGSDTLILDLKGDVNGYRYIWVDLQDGQLRNGDNSSQVYASLTSIENFDGNSSGWGSYSYFVIASGESNRIIGSSYDPARATVDYRNATNNAVITLSGSISGSAVAIINDTTPGTYRSTGTATDGTSTDTLINIGHANGGNFNDTITGTDANNTLNGVNGDDTLYGLGGDDYLVGGAGTDTLNGGAGNDTLVGGAGTDTLNGDNGDDLLKGGADADYFLGGAGTDTVSYADGGAVTVDTTSTESLVSTLGTGDANGDTFNSIEKFIGSASNDTFILSVASGSTLPIDINGSGGNDTIKLLGLVGGSSYSLSTLTPISTSNEGLNIKDGVSTALTISALDLQNFADATKPTITITHDTGVAGDSLTLTGGSNFFNSSGGNVGTSLAGSAVGNYTVMAGGVELAKVQWVA